MSSPTLFLNLDASEFLFFVEEFFNERGYAINVAAWEELAGTVFADWQRYLEDARE